MKVKILLTILNGTIHNQKATFLLLKLNYILPLTTTSNSLQVSKINGVVIGIREAKIDTSVPNKEINAHCHDEKSKLNSMLR